MSGIDPDCGNAAIAVPGMRFQSQPQSVCYFCQDFGPDFFVSHVHFFGNNLSQNLALAKFPEWLNPGYSQNRVIPTLVPVENLIPVVFWPVCIIDHLQFSNKSCKTKPYK